MWNKRKNKNISESESVCGEELGERSRFKSKLRRVLLSILGWFLFLIFAIVFAVALRVFLLASFVIPSWSMAPTLIPGDFVFVNKMIPGPRIFKSWDFLRNGDFSMRRLKGYRKIRRNDVIVFNYPWSNWNKLELDFNVFYAKRCIAVPGDTFYIDNGIYRVKNLPDTLGYYTNQKKLSEMKPEDFPPHIYKCYPDTVYGWNILNFGPLYIPGENDTVAIDTMNIRLYRKLIEYETQQPVEVKNGQVYIAEKPVNKYVFQQNYYFTAGDHVRDSRDSRYWGLLPEDHLVGKAFIIWKSKNRDTGKWQWKRFFKKL
ncbi:MAG: signal peptidase I [Prevotellaceae bacterium]|nr:signal peptidase I [Prevotellaceae bacterium]